MLRTHSELAHNHKLNKSAATNSQMRYPILFSETRYNRRLSFQESARIVSDLQQTPDCRRYQLPPKATQDNTQQYSIYPISRHYLRRRGRNKKVAKTSPFSHINLQNKHHFQTLYCTLILNITLIFSELVGNFAEKWNKQRSPGLTIVRQSRRSV